jgi:hypothetical protein
MKDIRIVQGKSKTGDIFWRIPKGTYIDNGDIIRVINDGSVINMCVAEEIDWKDIVCAKCPFNNFMGSHRCLLSHKPNGISYVRICDLPRQNLKSLRFTDLETIMENL